MFVWNRKKKLYFSEFQVVCKFIENTSNPQNLAHLIYSIFSETSQYNIIKSNFDQDEITDELLLVANEENSEILEFIVNSKISSSPNLQNNMQQDEFVGKYFDEKILWKKQKINSIASREIEPPKRLFLVPYRRLSLQHSSKISSALGNCITSTNLCTNYYTCSN